MILSRFSARLALGFALTLPLATAALHASPAEACGTISPRLEAQWAIEEHFSALNSHDRDALLGTWSKDAWVISRSAADDGTDRATAEPIASAATRWLTTKKSVTYQIETLNVQGHAATAHVRVTFDGIIHEDDLILAASGERYVIVSKVSRALAARTSAY